MTWLQILLSRISALFRKKQLDRQLDEEIHSHLEMLVEEKRRQGMSAEEARNTALREFGGVTQVRESYKQARGFRLVETLGQDVHYSLRMMRRNPGFTLIVVLLLALGIGVNTAIFSGIDAVLLRLLPVKDPQQLVMLDWTAKDFPQEFMSSLEGGSRLDKSTGQERNFPFSYLTFQHLLEHQHALSHIFAVAGNHGEVNVGLDGRSESAALEAVSGNFFEGIGVQALLGRMLLPSDDLESAAPVAVVSYGFWDRKLGHDRSIVGKTIVMNGSPVTIVGVVPPSFYGLAPGYSPDFRIPLSLYSWQWTQLGYDNHHLPLLKDQKTWWVEIVGRLKPGSDAAQAQKELAALFQQHIKVPGSRAVPENRMPVLGITPLKQGSASVRDGATAPLLLLMAMVGLVLLIACANVAGLLLTRASARQREIAVRLSLGAGRPRLIRQLLTESVMLAAIGGTAGLGVAIWGQSVLVKLLAGPNPVYGLEPRVDAMVLLFTLTVSLLSGILFGLAPALRATRVDLLVSLKQSAAGARGPGRFASGKILAGAQVAICLLLLITAGLFLRTLQRLGKVDLGFDRQNLLFFSVRPGLNGYKEARLAGFYEELQRRIQTIPGVRSVGFSQRSPIGSGTHTTLGSIPGTTQPGKRLKLWVHTVGPNYFDTFEIPVMLGRAIGRQDDRAAPHVIMVNQKLVHDYFHGDNPIGHRIDFGDPRKPDTYEIVGVVKDVKYARLRDDPPPTVYFSYLQRDSILNFMTFEVRAAGDMNTLARAIYQQAYAVDKDVPLTDLKTQVEVIDEALVLERAFASLSTSFGGLALLLACVGLYGTMAYTVARRANEIGIRMALGAERRTILRMILRETMGVVVIGLMAGLPLAWGATIILKSQLFGLSAHDPSTMLLATLMIIAVTALAGFIPARRASRVDPMVALRYE